MFSLVTTIERHDKQIFVCKRAVNSESRDFLYRILNSYQELKLAQMELKISPPKRISEDTIRFPYHQGALFGPLLFGAYRNGDKHLIEQLFQSYIQLINSIPTVSTPNALFRDIFGSMPNNDMPCVICGCLDLNFSNLFFRDNTFTLIDYEWYFPTPIPSRYIIFRAVTTFYLKYRDYRLNAIYPLVKLYKLSNISDQDIRLFIEWEYNFQKYVNNSSHPLPQYEIFRQMYTALDKDPEVSRPSFPLSDNNNTEEKQRVHIRNLEAQIENDRQRTASLKKQLIKQKSQIKTVEKMLQDINESRYWKMRMHYLNFISWCRRFMSNKGLFVVMAQGIVLLA